MRAKLSFLRLLPVLGVLLLDFARPLAAQPAAPEPDTFSVPTADARCTIHFDTTQAPELKDWAHHELAPVLAAWYPRIVALLPSDGFTAPAEYTVTLRPMDGVAYTTDRNVYASAGWLKSELGREAVGSLIHESVHVVQQLGSHRHNPGWLVEGTADYIRWFKFEPQSHGADLVWLRKQRHGDFRYDGSYRITANFLDWVTRKYDPQIVRELNAAMRAGNYDESLWKQCTGKTAPELGEEWQKAIAAALTAAGR